VLCVETFVSVGFHNKGFITEAGKRRGEKLIKNKIMTDDWAFFFFVAANINFLSWLKAIKMRAALHC
jgi:hypothetical protein